MAKYTKTLRGDFGTILRKVVGGVQNASVSATLEDAWGEETFLKTLKNLFE